MLRRRPHPLLLATALFATLILAFALGFLLWPSRSPLRIGQIASTATFPRPVGSTNNSANEIHDLQARLEKETAARKTAERETAFLKDKVAPLADDVVVSYGKVEDIGKRAGAMLQVGEELRELSARDPKTLTPDETRRLVALQRQHAELLGMLPEITAFQDQPAQYGKFFRNMIGQAANLNDSQAQQVETYMSSRATAMDQACLNASSQPGNVVAQAWWEIKRDHFNEQTASGLAALLPPGAAQQAGVGPQLMEFLEMDFDKAGTLP